MDQNTLTIVAVIAVILVALLIWMTVRKKRTDHLREKFGDEYDRTLGDVGRRDAAEANLAEREKRVSQLTIRPLTHEERDRYTSEWVEVKALFVDAPREAVLRGDRLLTGMLEKRGYPMADFDRRYEDLTVDHAETARHYREGHEIAHKADATTEEMRRALNRYEKLFEDMVSDAVPGDGHAAAAAPETSARAVDLDGDGDADLIQTRREPVTRPD